MATFAQVKVLAEATYKRIWGDWYQGMSNVKPARHEVAVSDLSAGYSHSENWLYNPVCEGNLTDHDILEPDQWPIWKIDLVHEMLHEYAEKAIEIPSAQGIALHRVFKNKFYDRGHDEKFFSAIAEKASYFGMTPPQLIDRI